MPPSPAPLPTSSGTRRAGAPPAAHGRTARRRPARRARGLLFVLAALLCAGPAAAQEGSAQAKYAGTYRIEGWESLAEQGVHQFFYLHPSGVFVLAAEWPGNETSRFVGTWSVTGDRLYLNGAGSVETNQGAWQTDYHRTFRVTLTDVGYRLQPVPEKNRFGLMGWPTAYRYYRPQPEPNLPSGDLPTDEDALLAWIRQAMKAHDAAAKP